jgi:glycosyltransferase involved in cell wall biosynthesis
MDSNSISLEQPPEAAHPAVQSPAQAVLVLGMHRSGTSVLTRILNLLGVELGEDLMPASPANEKGFWEHRRVVEIHNKIFDLFGRDWNTVAELPPRWWDDPRIRDCRAELRDVLQQDFSGQRLWGMKDPRLCDMLPLWLAVLAEMGVQPRCVLTFRNPVEVASSLEKYHGTLPSRAYILWLRSLLNAERYSRGLPRAIVSYEAVLADWSGQLNHIDRQVRIDWPHPRESVASAVAEFVQPRLRHYTVDDRTVLDDAAVPELVRRAYRAALASLDSGNADRLSETFDQIGLELNQNAPMQTQFAADADAQLRTTTLTVNRLATAHAETTARLAAAEAETARLRREQQQLSDTLTEAEELRKALVEKFTEAIRERDLHIDRLHQEIGRRLDERRLRMLRAHQEKKQDEKPELKPTVVVIVPFYNGSAFIERAVESIFMQSVPADEVIIVNDGSKDSERDMLHALAKKHPFKIIDKENGGQGSARNAGVAASTSNFICFLDQDDFYLANHIEVLVKGIPKDDPVFGWVYADLAEAEGDGAVVRTGMIKELAAHPKRTVIDLLGSDMFILPSASLISRKAYDAIGGFDTQFVGYEDDDLFMRLFRKGFTNYFVDKAVTVWCIHLNSASYSIKMSRSRMLYFKKLSELFPDEPKKARFYFRDCLMPRFGKLFIADALNAAKNSDPNRAEFCRILREYAALVRANPSVTAGAKRRLNRAVLFLTRSSPWMINAAETAAAMPVVRMFRVGI